ncbi:MAG: carboxypeptidase-like regulatory domain-containing protein [Bacteroidota bacterium]
MRLALLLLLAAPVAALAQPATIIGTVRDASGLPVPGANVYLSGTTLGDATDRRGQYRIEGIAPGAYRLVGSMIGFAPSGQNVRLAGGDFVRVDLDLAPIALEVDAVSVEVERDRRWERRLARFTRALIGESSNADSTRILNPEVLDFDESWGTLRATARAPLEIVNEALGYQITYDLESCEASAGGIQYDGSERFDPLLPSSPAEAQQWVRARERAYRGSQQHLFQSLLAGTAEAEGFTLTQTTERGQRIFGGLGSERTAADEILSQGTYGWGSVRFVGTIDVVYSGEPESPEYLTSEWFAEDRRTPGSYQRSSLELSEGMLRVDPQGTPEDPLGITTSGYMAFERLADRVPEDYAPEALVED